MLFQSAQLRRSSVLNGPFCSHRKIGGKTAVQQSPSRQTHSRQCPTMQNMALHEKQKVGEEQPKPTAAHHTITTALLPDNTRSSALVRSQSTWSMAGSSCWSWRRPNETGLCFCHYRAFFYTYVYCVHIRIHICWDWVHPDSSGPPSVLFQPLGSHCAVCACVCIYTHTPKYTPTRVKNRKTPDNTFVSPSVKNKPPRQMTSALHRLVEPPHPCPPTRMNKLCTLARAHVHSLQWLCGRCV